MGAEIARLQYEPRQYNEEENLHRTGRSPILRVQRRLFEQGKPWAALLTRIIPVSRLRQLVNGKLKPAFFWPLWADKDTNLHRVKPPYLKLNRNKTFSMFKSPPGKKHPFHKVWDCNLRNLWYINLYPYLSSACNQKNKVLLLQQADILAIFSF